jgi:hypothetical protein
LTVIMVLFASWIKTMTLERNQLRAQQDRLQTEYLASSGLERAAAQLAKNSGYPGETWQISAESFGGLAAATVDIRVLPVPDESAARLVRVVADFPAEGTARARRSKEIKIVLNTLGEAP